MRILDGRTVFSAGDLVAFMGCTHATRCDLANLTAPRSFPPDDEATALLQARGIEHELAYLAALRAEGRNVAEIAAEGTPAARAAATLAAMRTNADVVYQGAFLDGRWHGYSDFLLRAEAPSDLGTWSYDVADTKLARTARPKHLLQLCVYAELLGRCQGVAPGLLHVVLGDGTTTSVPYGSVSAYAALARKRFEAFADAPPVAGAGDPCGHCAFCRWAPDCGETWEAGGHLSLVAGMTKTHAVRLREAGVGSLPALAALGVGDPAGRVRGAVLARLRGQAALQHGFRTTGERRVETLPPSPGFGLARLPVPDVGDMFLDLEGDPLFDGGLEYLFGIVTVDDGAERFNEFWAHDREAERTAFEGAVDLIVARLARHPAAHVYHYAAYEVSAFRHLAMWHGTREAEVDDLLRQDRFVDLYRVVRESIRTSEPSYSIKAMERFYLPGARTGEVTTAGDSIVIYERWRRTGDDALLAEIGRYNEIDCVSTLRCRDWLLGFRPEGMPWRIAGAVEREGRGNPAATSDARREAEARAAAMASALLTGAADARDLAHRQLVVDLSEFHRREAKPSWWAMFERRDMAAGDLIDDAECLAGLSAVPGVAPRADKRSAVWTFSFPAQDFKLRVEDKPLRAGTLEPAGEVVAIDEDARRIELKFGPSRTPLADGECLIPAGPVGDAVLRAAIERYAEALIAGSGRYGAVDDVLRRATPRLQGATGVPVVPDGAEATAAAVDAVARMDGTYLLIQGPPGAGKTYTSAQAIVSLLAAGRRVGIASNGHKAINNLLVEVEALASAHGLAVRGVKKSSRADQMLATGGWIEETLSNDGVLPVHQLVAGTAWLFARPELDQAFDYLFVDEAGQIGLANVVAMGVSARNVVLVGDQMQLSQPVKGTHPRGSGASALDHLLEGRATVPPGQGVFLPVTRRMHPDLCAFVSQAVYEGRLRSSPDTAAQRVAADFAADPEALAPAGLRFVEVASAGCTQRSEPEAARIATTYALLMAGTWTDRSGATARLTPADVLVVTPYNMQVDLLRRTLPPGARVGTVDKFQGQEAAVVLVSMTTSSGDDLPRDVEFLFNLNRLNVAVSRARCLAVIYASPQLLEIGCTTIRQMTLVNGLCRAHFFARSVA